ncbi:MAG: hypothetical protein ACUVQ0_04205 [Thermoproteota archaeon]
MTEILEESLKDVAWISVMIAISLVMLNSVNNVVTFFLNSICKEFLLEIENFADLSAIYEGEFTLHIPNILLLNYSIILNGNDYTFMIQGIPVFKSEGKYCFNYAVMKPGKKYSTRTLGNIVFVNEK